MATAAQHRAEIERINEEVNTQTTDLETLRQALNNLPDVGTSESQFPDFNASDLESANVSTPTSGTVKYTGEDAVLRQNTVINFNIGTSFGDATESDVTDGKTFSSNNGINKVGTKQDSSGTSGSYDEGYLAGSAMSDAILMDNVTEYINNTALTVRAYAFYQIAKIESVAFNAATSLSFRAFNSCKSLKTARFPKVGSMGSYTFASCTALESVVFDSATRLDQYVFSGDTAFTTLVIKSKSVCVLANTNTFNSTPIANGEGGIYVPDDLVASYKAAANWSTFANVIKPLSECPIAV